MALAYGFKWGCSRCTYTMRGDHPPEFCPRCEAEGEEFIKVDE